MDGRNGFLVLVYQASRCIADQRPLSSTPGCRTHLLPKKTQAWWCQDDPHNGNSGPPSGLWGGCNLDHSHSRNSAIAICHNNLTGHSQPTPPRQWQRTALLFATTCAALPGAPYQKEHLNNTKTCPKTRNQTTYKPPWQHMHPLTSGVCATALAPLAQLHLLRMLGPTAPLEDTRR